MKLEVINIEGKKVDSVEVSDKIFSAEVNKKLVKSVVDWQLNHAKPRVAKTKQRNEIKGSTAKIYAQKGTGGARHSSRKAPIFVGGGVALRSVFGGGNPPLSDSLPPNTPAEGFIK